MSIEEQIKIMECIKCGSKSNLVPYKHEKSYKTKTGGAPVYTVHTQTLSIQIPTCQSCNEKFEKWNSFIYSFWGLICVYYIIVIVAGIFFFFSSLYSAAFSIIGVLTFLVIYLKYNSSENNPNRYVKFNYDKKPVVRPYNLIHWSPYSLWINSVLHDRIYGESEEYTTMNLINSLGGKDKNSCPACFTFNESEAQFCRSCGLKL